MMGASAAAAVAPPPTSWQLEELRQLRQIILDSLEQRRRHRIVSGGSSLEGEDAFKRAGGASLDDVYAGAKAFATGMMGSGSTAAPKPPAPTAASNSTGSPIAAWFENLYHHHMLPVMPLPAWIAIFVVAFLLFVGLLVLAIVCCCRHCGRRRAGRDQEDHGSRRSGKKDKQPVSSVPYKDIDVAGQKHPPCGVINYSLEYDTASNVLSISVANCLGLPKEVNKQLDAYLVIQVSPDSTDAKLRRQQQDQSKVVMNSCDPAFNFTRRVKIRDKRDLKRTTVTFEIYDWDIAPRHRMVARRAVSLAKLAAKLDDILGKRVDFANDLQPGVSQEPTGPGEVCLALCYSSQEKHLWVHIIECKGVFLQRSERPDYDTIPNAYVKLTLSLAGSTKYMTRSTSTVKESRNPYFNAQFVFRMEPAQMQIASLRLALMHRTETLRLKRALGVVTLSLEADKDSLELVHWQETLQYPGRPMARWHSFVTLQEEQRRAEQRAATKGKKQLEIVEEPKGPAAATGTASGGSAGTAAVAPPPSLSSRRR